MTMAGPRPGRFEAEQLDKGFKVCVYEEMKSMKKEDAMYPHMHRYEAAVSSPEEVKAVFEKWVGGASFVEESKGSGTLMSEGAVAKY